MEYQVVDEEKKIAVINVNERLYGSNTSKLIKVGGSAIGAGYKNLIIDLKDMTLISSSGIGGFVSIAGDLKKIGGKLVITGEKYKQLKKELKSTNLIPILMEIASSVDKARMLF